MFLRFAHRCVDGHRYIEIPLLSFFWTPVAKRFRVVISILMSSSGVGGKLAVSLRHHICVIFGPALALKDA